MFISRDPIGLLGGVNVFAYAPNPIHWVDVLGLCGCKTSNKSKTAKEMADELYAQIRKNSVTYQTPTRMGHIDIAGAEHLDKKTKINYTIPHVQESPINMPYKQKTGEIKPIKSQE